MQFPDTPDNSLTAGTLVGTDGGLTPSADGGGALYPNGPMPAAIAAQLQDAGLYADAAPDAIVYHELPPAAAAHDNIVAKAETKAVDVYFLEDTYSAAKDEIAVLDTSISTLVDQVRVGIPDSWFGGGRFEQYNAQPWNTTGDTTVVFDHAFSMSPTKLVIKAGMDWIAAGLIDTRALPRSLVSAIYALSTTSGLARTTLSAKWVPPRATWSSLANSESGACPAGTTGYPCFRSGALPITVVLTDIPSANGPGGTYSYMHDSANGVAGSTAWPAPTPVTANSTEATAKVIDPRNFAVYSGDTTIDGAKNSGWDGPFFDGCQNGGYNAAPNVLYNSP